MPNVKAIDIVSAIHKKVREEAVSYQTPDVIEEWSNDLARLQCAYNTAYCARNVVGSVPQLPNTFLGFLAGRVIGIAQRLLFWYTPQIRYFNEAATSGLRPRIDFKALPPETPPPAWPPARSSSSLTPTPPYTGTR